MHASKRASSGGNGATLNSGAQVESTSKSMVLSLVGARWRFSIFPLEYSCKPCHFGFLQRKQHTEEHSGKKKWWCQLPREKDYHCCHPHRTKGLAAKKCKKGSYFPSFSTKRPPPKRPREYLSHLWWGLCAFQTYSNTEGNENVPCWAQQLV